MAETSLFEKIQKANSKMPTITLQGKKYVQVKDRIVAFRNIFPRGTIETKPDYTENYVIFEARVYDNENKLLATGHSRVLLNKDKSIEKCESASVGRAMAMIGLGTSESIASYEEMEDMEEGTGIFDEDTELKKKLVEKFNKLDVKKKAEVLNMFRVKSADELKVETLKGLVNEVNNK